MPKKKMHQLKIMSRCYNDIAAGSKRFEIRRDDRGYQEGDMLVLRETKDQRITGRVIYALVNYIHRNDADTAFLSDGYIIMGIDIIRLVEVPA